MHRSRVLYEHEVAIWEAAKMVLDRHPCLQDYTVYLALTQNTNIFNLQSATNLGLDVTDDSYTSAPGDCQYANSTATSSGGRKLLDMDMGSGASPMG